MKLARFPARKRREQMSNDNGLRLPCRCPAASIIYARAERKEDATAAKPVHSAATDWKNMIDDVYNAKILGFAGNIARIGRLDHPDATARAHSKLCGSTVTVDLKMDGDVVTDFAHDVKACALGQASSSIMARHVIGANADELRAVRDIMLKMLKENGAPPEGRFADLKYLEPVRDYKARHASTMLTFDAVVDAIGQIEKKRAGQAA
ncbi:NifU-like protein involved in Fe-S cluster formation [Mesorhizobium shonense]|uniref:NifU-like protein involved in Fe-S cluster formation n=2 Tax=Phyllobacteriaceae TaxID=69277 RepID=A0ABV2HXG0_9HYPH